MEIGNNSRKWDFFKERAARIWCIKFLTIRLQSAIANSFKTSITNITSHDNPYSSCQKALNLLLICIIQEIYHTGNWWRGFLKSVEMTHRKDLWLALYIIGVRAYRGRVKMKMEKGSLETCLFWNSWLDQYYNTCIQTSSNSTGTKACNGPSYWK